MNWNNIQLKGCLHKLTKNSNYTRIIFHLYVPEQLCFSSKHFETPSAFGEQLVLWFWNDILQFCKLTKTTCWSPSPLHPDCSRVRNWQHKRQGLWVEVRTIYLKQQWHKKINSSCNNTNNRGYKKSNFSQESPYSTIDNSGWLFAMFICVEEAPPAWETLPFPSPWKCCEAIQNNLHVQAMPSPGYCRN